MTKNQIIITIKNKKERQLNLMETKALNPKKPPKYAVHELV